MDNTGELVQSIVILQIVGDPVSNNSWLLQWCTYSARHEKYFEYFEDVSRFVEGELLHQS